MRPLWSHQEETIRQTAESGWKRGFKRGVIVIPTGGGKTTTSMEMFRRFYAKNPSKRGVFYTERRILAQQAAVASLERGLEPGLHMADIPPHIKSQGIRNDPTRPFQVASWQTAEASNYYPKADFVVIDEGHRFGSADRQARLRHEYPNAHILYLTATPSLSDGRTLGSFCQFMINPVSVDDLIGSGLDGRPLVRSRMKYPDMGVFKGLSFPDDAVKMRQIMRQRMNRKCLVEDPVKKWEEYADGRRTFYFGYEVDDSKEVCRQFNARGIRSVHIDAETEDERRVEWFARFVAGEIKVICNYEVLTYGVDVPEVECVILRCPCRNITGLIQRMGRGIRACPSIGKTHCLFLDMAGVTIYHQYVPGVREVDWTLREENIDDRDDTSVKEGKEDQLCVCPNCSTAFSSRKTRQCPECGWVIKKKVKEFVPEESLSTTLREMMVRGDRPDGEQLKALNKDWLSFLFQVHYQGRSMGDAVARFSHRYGHPPWKYPLDFLPQRRTTDEWKKKPGDLWPKVFKAKVG